MTTRRIGSARVPATLRVFVVLAVALAGAAATAACGSPAGESGWTYAPPSVTPAASASPSASASASPSASASAGATASAGASASAGGSPATGNVFELEETADLQIKQAGQKVTQLQVKAGQAYTFRITNNANFAHDFYIGTAQDLQSSNTQNLKGVPQFSSGTKEFEYTFPTSGSLQFACTVPGHYATMHGDFVIQP
jgi:uncharacterized cupredoxin-like copper-binding protein